MDYFLRNEKCYFAVLLVKLTFSRWNSATVSLRYLKRSDKAVILPLMSLSELLVLLTYCIYGKLTYKLVAALLVTLTKLLLVLGWLTTFNFPAINVSQYVTAATCSLAIALWVDTMSSNQREVKLCGWRVWRYGSCFGGTWPKTVWSYRCIFHLISILCMQKVSGTIKAVDYSYCPCNMDPIQFNHA